jgi:hypothetical protein
LALGSSQIPAWSRDAVIYAGEVDRAGADGNMWVSVPVYMKVRSGRSVSGMQFVADIVGQNGAPDVTSVAFVPSGSILPPHPYGSSVEGLGVLPNTVFARWDNIEPGLTGTVLLGNIRFEIPNQTVAGQYYSIVVHDAGGATVNPDTGALRGLLFESIRGAVWPYVPHTQGPRVSDDWKTNFFGTVTNPSADPGADPDKDGFSNYEEYLAGSNPNVPDWNVRTDNGGFAFRWVGQANKSYTVEQTSDFKGWNAVTGKINGQDAFLEYIEAAPSAGPRFYRLRVE